MMKKAISLLLVLLMFLFAGCSQEKPVQTKPPTESTPVTEAATEPLTEETEPMDEYEMAVYEYYSQFVKIDDTTPLEEALTVSYPLEELTAYFYPANWDEFPQDCAELPWVNEVFPIEVMRSNCYTVYRVEEGGYFYVFWDGYASGYPAVFFSTYIPEDRTEDDFAKVEAGVTTFEEMQQMDPGMQYFASANVSSWSYLNPEELLQIRYYDVIQDEKGNYIRTELFVQSMEVIPREMDDGFIHFGSILPQDLP